MSDRFSDEQWRNILELANAAVKYPKDERVAFRVLTFGEQREGERGGEERKQIERVGRADSVIEFEPSGRAKRLEQKAAVLGVKHSAPRGSQSRARG